jgi:hypothetical protein
LLSLGNNNSKYTKSSENDEKLLCISCHYCDIQNNHDIYHCQKIIDLKSINHTLKNGHRKYKIKLLKLFGTIKDITILYDDHFCFNMDGYEKPCFFFHSKLNQSQMIELYHHHKAIQVFVYQTGNDGTYKMKQFFVYSMIT